MKSIIFFLFACVGLGIFLKGFFPVKLTTTGFATLDDAPSLPRVSAPSETIEKPKKSNGTRTEKLVWVIIDAMRYDFMSELSYRERMPFIKTVLENRQAKLYKSVAKTPTVTLPRLKSLTSGSISSFIDALLNMGSSPEFKLDNIVAQLKANAKKIVFYGDDTWIKLFPNAFVEQEGTTSFFVNDYTEVDNNVTRYLPKQLADQDNWDVMILHYLGLDHIGHLSGPQSLLMKPKLSEMDSILFKISQNFLFEKNHLMVVTSDHGMSASGSHGGSSDPEVHTPLLLIRSNLDARFDKGLSEEIVQQIDIAPSLALSMEVPIPRASMGTTILGLIETMNETQQLAALQYNCHQLLKQLPDDRFAQYCYNKSMKIHAEFLTHATEEDLEAAKSNYVSCQRHISTRLTSKLADYHYPYLYVGIAAAFLVTAISGGCWAVDVVRLRRAYACTTTLTRFGVVLMTGTVCELVTMGASSFVEEQHQTWHFLTSALTAAILIGFLRRVLIDAELSSASSSSSRDGFHHAMSLRDAAVSMGGGRLRRSERSGGGVPTLSDDLSFASAMEKLSQRLWLLVAVGSLVCHRVLKSWNQTGVKHLDLPDIGDWLNSPENNSLLSLLSIVGLFSCALLCDMMIATTTDRLRTLLTWLGLLCVYNYRATTRALALYGSDRQSNRLATLEARIVYMIAAALALRSFAHLATHVCKRRSSTNTTTSSRTRFRLPSEHHRRRASDTSRDLALDCAQACVVLLSALLLRPHNHPVLAAHLALFVVLMRCLWPVLVERKQGLMRRLTHRKPAHAQDDDAEPINPLQAAVRMVATYWFAQHAYFTLGNSNSFATIDVSPAYVGLTSSEGAFNTLASIMLGAFATYIGPLVWMTLGFGELIKHSCDDDDTRWGGNVVSTHNFVISTLVLIRTLTISFHLLFVFALRYHLFVWSVFAPKLIYETVATLVYGLVITLAYLLWR